MGNILQSMAFGRLEVMKKLFQPIAFGRLDQVGPWLWVPIESHHLPSSPLSSSYSIPWGWTPMLVPCVFCSSHFYCLLLLTVSRSRASVGVKPVPLPDSHCRTYGLSFILNPCSLFVSHEPFTGRKLYGCILWTWYMCKIQTDICCSQNHKDSEEIIRFHYIELLTLNRHWVMRTFTSMLIAKYGKTDSNRYIIPFPAWSVVLHAK